MVSAPVLLTNSQPDMAPGKRTASVCTGYDLFGSGS